MILSYQTIKRLDLVFPCREPGKDKNGNSYGLSACGYDIRIAQDAYLHEGEFVLASAIERFDLPDWVMGVVHDKSSLARQGLAVQNTVLEPGWKGYLTLELTYHVHTSWWRRLIWWGPKPELWLPRGSAIAQVVFHKLDEPTERPYKGKYQDQEAGPQPARQEFEEDEDDDAYEPCGKATPHTPYKSLKDIPS